MKISNWKETAELIGIAAIVASLIFVGLQMRQAAEIARAELVSGNLASEIEASAVYIENADIWRRGNAGEDLDANESVIFQGFGEPVCASCVRVSRATTPRTNRSSSRQYSRPWTCTTR